MAKGKLLLKIPDVKISNVFYNLDGTKDSCKFIADSIEPSGFSLSFTLENNRYIGLYKKFLKVIREGKKFDISVTESKEE